MELNTVIKKVLFILVVFIIVVATVLAFEIEKDNTTAQNTSMPTLNINVENNVWPQEKIYHDGEITLVSPTNTGNIINSSIAIRARGNGSLLHEKKSYKLKFDEEVVLIENKTQPAKDWVLLANYVDLSLMRNYYILESARAFDSFIFVPEAMFVEVIFNDVYQGVYLLCESIELNDARIDISDKYSGVENGFLLERDFEPTGELYQDYFYVNDVPYNIKSDVHSLQQVKYAEEIITTVENTIYSQNQSWIEGVIDVDSCIDMYLINEFSKNIDVGWGSFYMYLYPDDNKLYFGPPWDFDLSLGNVLLDEGSAEWLYVGNETYELIQGHHWYQELMKQEWFQLKVKERWNEVKHIFLNTIEEIETINAQYEEYFIKEQELWPYEERLSVHEMKPDALSELTTQNQQFNYLVEWINQRYSWLDNYFNSEM